MSLAAAHRSLVDAVLALRNADGGWPYYAGRASRIESTCWAALGTGTSLDGSPIVRWLNADGLLAEPMTGQVNIAFNGLAALALHHAGVTTPPLSTRIVAAIAAVRGDALPPSLAIRQDNSLQGWPWTVGTFSWIEPTAWCTLALKKAPSLSAEGRSRIAVGESILRDRECKGGGWNTGTAEVFGKSLPAHVPPTAVGLMSLQDRPADPVAVRAADFLGTHAVVESSTSALALSALALSCVDRQSDAIATALIENHADAIRFGNVAAMGMAAYALGCLATKTRPSALSLGGATR